MKFYADSARSQKDSNDFSIPPIRVEKATHRTCSQLIQTCLQPNILSCKSGEISDGSSRQFVLLRTDYHEAPTLG